MKFEITSIEEFDRYSGKWDELNVTTQNLAILESRFIRCLIPHFFKGEEILALGYEQETLTCMLFLEKVGFGRWQTVMPSQAPLCLWVGEQHDVDHLNLPELAKVLPGMVLQIDLLQVDSRNLAIRPELETMDYISTGRLPIPEDFESYFQGLGKNMRQNYNKVLNRARRAEQTLTSYGITNKDEMNASVIKYGEIESRSWKAEQGTEISPDNEQGRFYLDLMSEFAEDEKAACWFYKIDDDIAAVDMCIIHDHTLIILKTTFDEAFAKQSPALQMKVDMIRYYSEHPELGIKDIEFFGKAMEWHKRLQSELRDIVHVTWYAMPVIKPLKSLLKK